MVRTKCDLIKQLYEGVDSVHSTETSPRNNKSFERHQFTNLTGGNNDKSRLRRNLIEKIKTSVSMIDHEHTSQNGIRNGGRNANLGLPKGRSNLF